MKKLFILFLVLLAAAPLAMAQVTSQQLGAIPATKILLWTKEGEADHALQFVEYLAGLFTKSYPKITFEVINKSVEALREDFQTASLAGTPPDLLWTVSDHLGPFTLADLIQPVDPLFTLSPFVDSALAAVRLNGKTWGVPISNGNHLMLLYNTGLVAKPPASTNELFALVGKLPAGVYPLVWNQTEPFWLVPWLGAFGGKVFAADGVTPTLNTKEMVNTLRFLKSMKDKKLIPAESDYNGADTLFKEGKAAIIINGDWSLGGYKAMMGDTFRVARIPMVSATSKWPMPYTSGAFFMIPKELSGDRLLAVRGFILLAVSKPRQLDMVEQLARLPVLKEALGSTLITKDPILVGSADQMSVGVPMPTVAEMRPVWDAMKPEMQAVLAGTKTPEAAAEAMQKAAEAGIKALQ